MAKKGVLVMIPGDRANTPDRQASGVNGWAWPFQLAPTAVPGANAGVATRAVATPKTYHVQVVISAESALSGKIALPDSDVASERHAHVQYHVTPEVVTPAKLTRLLSIAGTSPPRAILLDIAALGQPGALDILQEVRCRLPDTHLLLGWPQADARQDAALLAQFDGSLVWSQFGRLGRVLDAVLAGELWFPRSVMQALYRHALDTGRGQSRTADANKKGVSLTRRASDVSVSLTRRETDVYVLMRRGLTNTQIAGRLQVSVNTVKKHLSRVFEKRGLRGRRQAID